MAYNRDRVFADANVLFSASYKPDHDFLFFWTSLRAKMLTSQYAADEVRRNVGSSAHLERLQGILAETEIVGAEEQQREHGKIILPAKDMPILSGALRGQSRLLVTGDKAHFGAYYGRLLEVPYGFLTIIEPAALLRLLREQK